MPKYRAIARAAPRPRFRTMITTIMLVLMTVMIVRDIRAAGARLPRRPTSRGGSPDLAGTLAQAGQKPLNANRYPLRSKTP
jgi:hypothetical protein